MIILFCTNTSQVQEKVVLVVKIQKLCSVSSLDHKQDLNSPAHLPPEVKVNPLGPEQSNHKARVYFGQSRKTFFQFIL